MPRASNRRIAWSFREQPIGVFGRLLHELDFVVGEAVELAHELVDWSAIASILTSRLFLVVFISLRAFTKLVGL
jgi:hypothetical protein